MSTRWYAKEPIEIIKALDSHESGLENTSIDAHRKKYGINILPEVKQLGIFSKKLNMMFLKKFA